MDVQRGAEVAHRLVVPGAWAVEQPESQDHAAPAGACEALGLLLSDERRAKDRQDLADWRVLGDRPVRRVDEGDGGLDVDRSPGRNRRIDEDPRRVRTQPIVLSPRLGIRDLVERADPGRQVQDAIHAAHGVGDRGGVEEIELLAPGHLKLMAGGLRERP